MNANATQARVKRPARPAPRMMSLTEYAAICGVSLPTARRHPVVPPVLVGRRVLFPRDAVLAALGLGPAADRQADPVARGPEICTAALR